MQLGKWCFSAGNFVHQIWRLPKITTSDTPIRISGKGTFQNVSSAGTTTLSPISTLMHPVSLKTQNMKVVELCLGVPYILNHLNRGLDERVMPKLRSNVKVVQNRPISYVLHLISPFAS